MSENDDSVTISKNMMLSISLIFSALILSGTIFMVGNSINNNLAGLTIAASNSQTLLSSGSSGPGSLAPAPSPKILK